MISLFRTIEDQLVKRGAKNILKLYDKQRLTGVAFIIDINGKEFPFRLPARIDRIEARFRSLIKKPRKGTLDKITEQAERTAWKILSDWVELDQAELLEVFMPYIYDHQKEQTFFEKMKGSGFAMLEDKSK